jgi:transcriptional regulator with XRE-family HTH domain
MAVTGDRLGRAVADARAIRARVATEVREARLNAGLSQAGAARAVGISGAQIGRIERAELRGLTVEQAARVCSAVGLRLVVGIYPAGDAPRDHAHLALLRRFRATLPVGVTMQTEVPIGPPGDLRAWDAIVTFSDGRVALEAETRLRDLQALERRVALKERDGDLDRVLLLVAATASNRRMLAAHRDALCGRFPMAGREILGAVRAGRTPAAGGVILL